MPLAALNAAFRNQASNLLFMMVVILSGAVVEMAEAVRAVGKFVEIPTPSGE